MRSFRHLTRTEIREVYAGYLAGTPKLSIAKSLQIDNATVHYHINKVKHLSETEIVALITPRCLGCDAGHTAFKCLKCGKAFDNMKSEEFQLIRSLRGEVEALKLQLGKYEKGAPLHTDSLQPIATVRC